MIHICARRNQSPHDFQSPRADSVFERSAHRRIVFHIRPLLDEFQCELGIALPRGAAKFTGSFGVSLGFFGGHAEILWIAGLIGSGQMSLGVSPHF